MKRIVSILLYFFLGYTLFSSGMAKLVYPLPFPGWIGPPRLIQDLEQWQLGLYAQFIAVSQVAVGLLLLTRRFALLGAIMAVPMFANILMITLSQHWPGTPYIVSILLLMNVALLILEFPRLKFLLIDHPEGLPKVPIRRRNLRHDLIWLSGFAAVMAGASCVRQWPGLGQILLITGGLVLFTLSVILSILRLKARFQKRYAPLKR